MTRSGQGTSKHDFDVVYYPCLTDTRGMPFGAFVHGNDDTSGAIRSIGTVTTGMSWRQVADPVTVVGAPDAGALGSVRELAATVGAYAIGLMS